MINTTLKWLTLLAVFALTACATNTTTKAAMLTGKVQSATLLANYEKFANEFNRFTLSDDELSQIKQWPKALTIEVFFGTWCHDSQREVPRLLKVSANSEQLEMRLIALDYRKNDPEKLAQSKGIKFTPTFIVHLGEKEIGRIVERPQKSLVFDISDMLNNSTK